MKNLRKKPSSSVKSPNVYLYYSYYSKGLIFFTFEVVIKLHKQHSQTVCHDLEDTHYTVAQGQRRGSGS